jgi:hypothetical protein
VSNKQHLQPVHVVHDGLAYDFGVWQGKPGVMYPCQLCVDLFDSRRGHPKVHAFADSDHHNRDVLCWLCAGDVCFVSVVSGIIRPDSESDDEFASRFSVILNFVAGDLSTSLVGTP